MHIIFAARNNKTIFYDTSKTVQKQFQALNWLAGVLTVFLSALFSFKKYLYLRTAGESVGDAAFFMLLMFVGILVMATIIYGALYYFLVPESVSAYRGYIRIRNKDAALQAEQERQESIQKEEEAKLREREELLQACIKYATDTFQNLLTSEELEALKANIIKFSKAETDFTSLDNKNLDILSTTDLAHLGWNIGKRLITKESKRKLGVETAELLKMTFPHQFIETELTTLAAKLTSNGGRFSIEIIKPAKPLIPYIFPAIEKNSD